MNLQESVVTEHPLTHRERLLCTLRHQPVDRVPDLEFGAWVQTLERWSHEGVDFRSCNGLCRPQYGLDHCLARTIPNTAPA
jgi:hypothetical protein